MLKIGGLLNNSLIDFPEKVASVIFTRGCDFRCPFCHNPDLIYYKGESLSVSEVLENLKKNRRWIDGVAITGGEPLLNPDIIDMIRYIRDKIGLLVKIDTNGNHPEMVDHLIRSRSVDYFAMDVKHVPETERYSMITGVRVDIENIVRSIELIKESGIEHNFRTTVIPDVHSVEDLVFIKDFVSDSRYILQNFSNRNPFNPELRNRTPYTPEEFRKIREQVF